jgi:hypothetical protein
MDKKLQNNCGDVLVRQQLDSPLKRHHVINYLIRKYDYKSYLEIGTAHLECFNNVHAVSKVGIDPNINYQNVPDVKGTLINVESDIFFSGLETDEKFDIIFIDGDHSAKQVVKDIVNALNHLKPNGVLLLHDCIPCNAAMQTSERETIAWTGDVWKAMMSFQHFAVGYDSYIIDTDFGIGYIKPRLEEQPCFAGELINSLTWQDFTAYIHSPNVVISTEQFFTLHQYPL